MLIKKIHSARYNNHKYAHKYTRANPIGAKGGERLRNTTPGDHNTPASPTAIQTETSKTSAEHFS